MKTTRRDMVKNIIGALSALAFWQTSRATPVNDKPPARMRNRRYAIDVEQIPLAELKRQLLNEECEPLCNKHPITQYCMRIAAVEEDRGDPWGAGGAYTEELCIDDSDWRLRNAETGSMMFNSYRIKPERIDAFMQELKHITGICLWNDFFGRKPLVTV